MDIYKIDQLQKLVVSGESNWTQYGEVQAIEKDGLIHFGYTSRATYVGRWNWFERNARGLVLNRKTGEIVARPMIKFFNYGQRMPMPNTSIVSVAEKLDGSLAILYKYSGEYGMATTGSLSSEQGKWALQWFNDNALLKHELDTDNWTFMFEAIYPENRIVVNYGDIQGLFLIAARNKRFGHELYESELDTIADKHGFYRPIVYNMSELDEILTAVEKMTDANQEGFVLRYSDNERFKVKSEAYLLAHKFIGNISFKSILEAVKAGVYDELTAKVPDEFLDEVKQHRQTIVDTVDNTIERINAVFAQAPQQETLENERLYRKRFATWAAKQPVAMSYLMAMLDNKSPERILDMVYKNEFNNLA